MQEEVSRGGPPLVSGSSQGDNKAAFLSEKAAPQQAEPPGTAEQGLGNSDEPDTAAPAETLEMPSSPAVVAAAVEDAAVEREKTCKSSKNAAIASGSRAGGSQAVSRKPLTAQQHAVVAALMVVMKRAMLEGDEAPDIRAHLICNNKHTMIVLQYTSKRKLPSMKAVEHMLERGGQGSLDLLAKQCAAAGFQPLQVFTRSAQCGAMAECRAANKGGEPLALDRHAQVAELHRKLVEHGLPPTWISFTIDQLVQWGASACMAELVMFWLLLLAKLCERCLQPNAVQDAAVDYAALFPGSSQFHTNLCKLAVEDAAVGYAAMDLLFPGVLCVMLWSPKMDWTCAKGLARLLGPMEKVLQEYKARAVASGQTFEQTVRLEAAVLGWPEDGPLYTKEVLQAMVDAELALASSAGAEPAGAAAEEDMGYERKAAAAPDSTGSQAAQAAGAAAGADSPGQRGSQAEIAQPGAVPVGPEMHAIGGSAGDAPSAGSGGAAAALSLQGQPSSSKVDAGGVGANGSPPVATSAANAVAERSTAHGAPLDSGVWDTADGSGGSVQTSSVGPGTAEQELSNSNDLDMAAPAKPLEMQSSPAVVAAATEDADERGNRRKSSKNAAIASGSRAGGSQAVSRRPLTAQQHAVVAALMVVLKRATLEGHVASITARVRLCSNNKHTLVVLQFIRDDEELPSMKYIEQMLQRDDLDLLDLLARQCSAAGVQPLGVFTASVQCGTVTAWKALHATGDPLALARHTQVAELHRVFVEAGLPPPWIRATVNLLVRQGVLARMAELVMVMMLLLAELCKRCFRADPGQDGAVGYAALEHLFPGVLDALLHGPKRDWISARGLTHLLGPTEKALQGHKARAVAYEQTFEQVIRLEAAVLGWPEGGPPYAKEVLQAMIDAELALASSAGAEPAGAAAREDVGRESKAPAAPDSPGSQAAQAAGAAAAAVAVALGQRGRWAEAALPGSMPRGPGAHADEDAAPLSLEGQPSSSNAYTGHADTGGSPPVATFTSAAERSTAHGAPQDGGVWDTRDGIGSKLQTSSAQTAQSKPCSVTVAGTAAVGSSAGQLASHKAGRQPAETGNTEREVSTSARAACAEKPQAAHDGQSPDVAQPATGPADTLRASAEAGGNNCNVIKSPCSIVNSDLESEIQCRLLPGWSVWKCSTLIADNDIKLTKLQTLVRVLHQLAKDTGASITGAAKQRLREAGLPCGPVEQSYMQNLERIAEDAAAMDLSDEYAWLCLCHYIDVEPSQAISPAVKKILRYMAHVAFEAVGHKKRFKLLTQHVLPNIEACLPRSSEPMSVMLEPQWGASLEAFIEGSVLEYALCAAQARGLGSSLVTDSFLENVLIQKLDHRLKPSIPLGGYFMSLAAAEPLMAGTGTAPQAQPQTISEVLELMGKHIELKKLEAQEGKQYLISWHGKAPVIQELRPRPAGRPLREIMHIQAAAHHRRLTEQAAQEPSGPSLPAAPTQVTSSDLEYEGSESEPGYEPETDREDESEHSPKEGPHLTGAAESARQRLVRKLAERRTQQLCSHAPSVVDADTARSAQPDVAPVRALTLEDKAEKRKVKKERQRKARAQAAAKEAPDRVAGSSAGPPAQQSPGSVQRSSPASPELPVVVQQPSSAAQTGAPAAEAVVQAAERLLAQPPEAQPQPPSGGSRKGRKGKGKVDRSGAHPTGSVHLTPAVRATSPGVSGSDSTTALPGPQISSAQETMEPTSALSSPAQRPGSPPPALRGPSSAQRLQTPIQEVTFAAHQPQNGDFGVPSPGQHTDRGAQALSSPPSAPEEESWQKVRPGRRKPAAKPAAAGAGKGRSTGQARPEALPRPTAAAPATPQRAQRVQAPPGFAAGPNLPKPGPAQADIGEAPQQPALHASPQRLATQQQPFPMVAASTDVIEPQGHGQEEDEHLCVVCIDNDRFVMFLSCGHLCACESCADDIMSRTPPLCPMCRSPIERTLKVKF